MRKLRFKPSLADTVATNAKAMNALALQHGVSEAGQAHIDEVNEWLQGREEVRKERAARGGSVRVSGRDYKPESDVLREILDYLMAHPAVLLVERVNSGAAQDEHGRRIDFHRLYLPKGTRAEAGNMKVVDLRVMLRSGQTFVIECKRSDWTKPTDERERQQAAYIEYVRSVGNLGCFAVCVDDVAWTLQAAGY